MRVLLLTGRKAAEMTRASAEQLAEEHGWGVDVRVLPVDLGAFVTTELVRGLDSSGYDLVLVPGLAKGDYSGLALKGTKRVVDLGLLDPEDFEELSPRLPADRLVSGKAGSVPEGEPELYVGDLGVGGDTRMKVVAEIVDATECSREELERRAAYYLEQGADVVDLGVPLDADPSDVAETAEAACELVESPVSLDTMEPDLIEAGAPFVDMALSADAEVLSSVGDVLVEENVVTVLVPGETGLEKAVAAAEDLGLDYLIDPVLDPPLDTVESLCRYREADGPLFFGAGNVTELLDADSVGVNALLAAAAQEVDAAMVFTTEHSTKTRGAVMELAAGVRMMRLADSGPPKDLGIDLLVLKDKVDRDEPVEELGEVVEASDRSYERDPLGYFRIGLDRESRELLAVFHSSKGEHLTVRGPDARTVYTEICGRGLVSLESHAAYLGAELAKAEAALATGKSYRQDEALFPDY